MIKFSHTIFYVEDVIKTIHFYELVFELKVKFIHESKTYAELMTGDMTLAFASEELGKMNLPKGFQKNSAKSDPETKLRAYLFCVAICHQTHTLIQKSLNLVGFNYLEKVFADLAKMESELLDPAFVAKMTSQELALKLGELFSEAGESTLDRLGERADLLIEMSRKLVDGYSGRGVVAAQWLSGGRSRDLSPFSRL